MVLELFLKLTSRLVFFFFFSFILLPSLLYIIELIVVVIVIIMIIELIFEIKDNLLVEIFTYNFKTLNYLLNGFFNHLYIYIGNPEAEIACNGTSKQTVTKTFWSSGQTEMVFITLTQQKPIGSWINYIIFFIHTYNFFNLWGPMAS